MASAAIYHQLVRDYYEALYRFAYRLSGSANDASDLVQETYRVAFESIHQLQKVDSARSWLFTILVNLYRQQRRRGALVQYCPPEALTERADVREPLETEEDWEPQAIDPQQLHQAIQELDEDFRIPLLLHYMERFKYREIAEQLGIPIGTVMSRINRAKEQLRRLLESKKEKGKSPLTGTRDVRHAMP
jgi:RNA polymerase sigma-70 factor (ECF subfamily)